jgi:uncharacterized protein with FMN-binding domain
MSSNTKIVVLRSKELVYALIFLVLSVLIIIAALSLLQPKDDETDDEVQTSSSSAVITTTSENITSSQSTALYVPGIYSSVVSLGNVNMELNVAVDYDHINSITLTNLDETIETLYPLMSPTLSELSATIIADQSTDNITYPDDNRYTSMLLMQAINEAIDKAKIEDTEY